MKNDLFINYIQDFGDKEVEIEIRYFNVTWEQALGILGTYQNDQIKSFTWE
jgi:hypothetical protein